MRSGRSPAAVLAVALAVARLAACSSSGDDTARTTTTARPATTAAPKDPARIQFRPVLSIISCAVPRPTNVPTSASDPCRGRSVSQSGGTATIPSSDDRRAYLVGPVGFDGAALASAKTEHINGEWLVNLTIRADHLRDANATFNTCYRGTGDCPARTDLTHGSVAIVFDGRVISAPAVQAEDLASNPSGFSISGNFDRASARSLARSIRP